MLTRIARYIKKNNMLPQGCRVLVGVSGGMDSVALLHSLCKLRDRLGFELSAAHFNHGIRAEATEEEQFVKALCASLAVPLFTGRADVPALAREQGISLEVAARHARHAFFRRTMGEQGFDRLALAHHMDDQAETVLLRLIRGSGGCGLGAMAPVEETGIIRPLLCVGRADIQAWCAENGFEWREDATNADTANPRNFIRHEVMPRIRDNLNPSAASALCRAAELLRQDEQYMDGEGAKAIENAKTLPDGSVAVPVSSLSGLHQALLGRALRLMLAQAGLAKDVEQVNIDDVASLLADGMTGCRVDLGRGFTALREAEALVIAPSVPQADRYAPVLLAAPGRTAATGGMFSCELFNEIPTFYKNHTKYEQYFDADAFPAGAVARGRQPGDRFHPLGAEGGKKLKEYLIDRKVSRWGRDDLPLLACQSDVLWVVGHAIADAVKITEKTHRVLKITYTAGEDTL